MLKGAVIGLLISMVLSAALYKWLAFLVAVWLGVLMGGIVSFWTKRHFAWGVQFGALVGLSIILSLLILGPWNLYGS